LRSNLLHSLQQLHVDDAFGSALARLLDGTGDRPTWLVWRESLERFGTELGITPSALAPFLNAWCLLYIVTLALDHVQDGDALSDPWFAAQPAAMQYQLVFSTFAVALHALSQLPAGGIPPERIVRLHARWAASITQIAEGQYLDLAQGAQQAATDTPSQALLTRYERIAAQKTGATFALGFGGVAELATDSAHVVEAASRAGLAYGLLLQYNDDLLDAATQRDRPQALTLERALCAAYPEASAQPAQAAQHFWRHVYAQYIEQFPVILAPLPSAAQTIVFDLLRDSFGPSLIHTAQR